MVIEKIVIIEKTDVCNQMNFSSTINEVIWEILNFLLFFYEKISHAQKSTKKHQKPPKTTISTKTQVSKSAKRK